MTIDQMVSVFSALLSFISLLLVVWQLRDGNRQKELQSMIELYDINRDLLSLGLSTPALLKVLEDEPITDSLTEKRYLQLWLNQLSLSYSFLQRSVFQLELQEELRRNLIDFLGMKNMQRHWQQYGSFYPDSFQQYVNGILKKDEPPAAAHPRTQ